MLRNVKIWSDQGTGLVQPPPRSVWVSKPSLTGWKHLDPSKQCQKPMPGRCGDNPKDLFLRRLLQKPCGKVNFNLFWTTKQSLSIHLGTFSFSLRACFEIVAAEVTRRKIARSSQKTRLVTSAATWAGRFQNTLKNLIVRIWAG